MRLILSRKGFDSSSGGCPSPIFPDGSMIALPIPDTRSPVRYQDLLWRGWNLGEVVAELTTGCIREDHGAHLDPDLRPDLLSRPPRWLPTLGQHAAAQGHLRNQGVCAGDLFLFFGLFRPVDASLRWVGRPEHHVWGWLQIASIAPVDTVARVGGAEWRWLRSHPHLAFPPDPTNTLYVGADRLSLPGRSPSAMRGSGTFDHASASRRLTAARAKSPSEWTLPGAFLPRGRPPLSYHGDLGRWSRHGKNIRLRAAARGQEFVLDLERYPEVTRWLEDLLLERGGSSSAAPPSD